jgi:predicted ATP-grasp superfamily ATP-dependent carboligase
VAAEESLLIIGASVRAAAFSALRAGLRPWCVDLFADADLRAVCPAHRLEGKYPHGFEEWFDRAPPGPWMYTGGLENWPGLIGRWARRRPLWGAAGEALARARDPALYRWSYLPRPEVRLPGEAMPGEGRWLLKPRRGAAGQGIRFLTESDRRAGVVGPVEYAQQHLDGTPASALFRAGPRRRRVLGLTRQLVGEPWLHAAPFHYCGSVGPLRIPRALRRMLTFLSLRLQVDRPSFGLFGIDGVLRGEEFWPVEVNPRYTSSVEVVEYATGYSALRDYPRLFAAEGDEPEAELVPDASDVVGKAILFAQRDVTFPTDGPWNRSPPEPLELPSFADIPDPGARIQAGRPVLTFFARAPTMTACMIALRETAADLDRLLFGA